MRAGMQALEDSSMLAYNVLEYKEGGKGSTLQVEGLLGQIPPETGNNSP